MAGGIAIVVAIVSIPRHLTPTPNSIRNPNSMCNKSKDRMLLQLEDLLLTMLLFFSGNNFEVFGWEEKD